MTKRSITITGLTVSLIGFLFQQSGLDIPQTDIETFLSVSLQAGGILVAWIERWRRGDITLFGKRK